MRYLLGLVLIAAIFINRSRRMKARQSPVEVFTPDFVATLPALNKFSNPRVVLLCRDSMSSNIRMRESIEQWFQKLSSEHKSGMLARLQDTNDIQHLSAFFELVVQNYFENQNIDVVKDPEQPDGTTPDFSLSKNGDEIFVEVRTIMADAAARISEKAMADALIQLDKIDTKYSLAVHFETDPATQNKPSALKREVTKWLSTLQLPIGERVNQIFQEGGFHIDLSVSNQGLEVGAGKVWYSSDPVKILGRSLPLMRSGIKQKAAKYKDLQNAGKPYVVALCSTDFNFVLEDVWMTLAAYGTLEQRAAGGGTFVLSNEQGKKIGLSGLLHFMLIQDRDTFALHAKYYPNPAAAAPVPETFGWTSD